MAWFKKTSKDDKIKALKREIAAGLDDFFKRKPRNAWIQTKDQYSFKVYLRNQVTVVYKKTFAEMVAEGSDRNISVVPAVVIANVTLDEALHRGGFYSWLLEDVERRARASGAKALVIENVTDKGHYLLYVRRGFTPVGYHGAIVDTKAPHHAGEISFRKLF